ncbi:hypothetical protein QFC21_003432 [Naganishia friedmannii]|uniref:Uncharacterized protein n=1 Tax=Naganishia friedmannii TaxID=89922 RepID=A0ACC2VP88_9TREE|nr:hypothetical protein QFC21_003432 [Naganishia friedmannii]
MYRSTVTRVTRHHINHQLSTITRPSFIRTLHIQSPLLSSQSVTGTVIDKIKTLKAATERPIDVASEIPAFAGPAGPEVTKTAISRTPLLQLLRTYLVYTICSFPTIVDNSPALLSALTKSKIPGVAAITEYLVRRTFFAQFVGGETTGECTVVMEQLRKEGIGSMLVYSVEVDEDLKTPTGMSEKEMMEKEGEVKVAETLRCLERAGQFEREMQQKYGGEAGGTYIAIKITGLTSDPTVLHRASNTLTRLRERDNGNPVHFPGSPIDVDAQVLARPLAHESSSLFNMPTDTACRGGILAGEENLRHGDMELLRGIWQILLKIGQTAKQSGIKIAVDAEHSWYQPAIDGYTMLMSQEFNKIHPEQVANPATSPLIYGTYQAYLRRSDGHLAASLKHAKENNYTLGVKLVRGAYAEQERKKWITDGRAKFGADPIQPTKQATHAAFDGATKSLIAQLAKDIKTDPKKAPSVGVFFGTHNGDSCDLIADSLVENGLAQKNEEGRLVTLPGVRGRVSTGQLFGMSDNLTEAVAAKFEVKGAPMVLKYLPYGSLKEVLPYLGRRAIENKSMLNGEGGASFERGRVLGEIKRRMGLA